MVTSSAAANGNADKSYESNELIHDKRYFELEDNFNIPIDLIADWEGMHTDCNDKKAMHTNNTPGSIGSSLTKIYLILNASNKTAKEAFLSYVHSNSCLFQLELNFVELVIPLIRRFFQFIDDISNAFDANNTHNRKITLNITKIVPVDLFTQISGKEREHLERHGKQSLLSTAVTACVLHYEKELQQRRRSTACTDALDKFRPFLTIDARFDCCYSITCHSFPFLLRLTINYLSRI
jgi:hypothetical protein